MISMELLLAHWDLILLLIGAVAGIILKVVNFLKKPSEQRKKLMVIWLIKAVTEAELEFADYTKAGNIKFSKVYQKFVAQYKWVGIFISEETFSEMIELALVEMKKTLVANSK